MTPKPLLMITAALLCLSYSSQAQLLKKVKDKVNKTINGDDKSTDKKEDANSSSDNTSSSSRSTAPADDDSKNAKWCDGLDAPGGSGGSGSATKDGVEYKKVYSSENGFTILYDESSLGSNKEFSLVLSEKVNNKYQFVYIKNGEVVGKDSKVHPEWISNSSQTRIGKHDEKDAVNNKYIVGDTMKQDIPKSDAKKATVQKIDNDQMEMALQVARQQDDYKKMSDAEKKEFEENVKKALAANNSMAGTTFDVPAQQGGTVAMVNGYYVVIKGKKFGKFLQQPVVEVSKDETKFLAVGINEQAEPIMIVNGKTTPLDKNKFNAMNGRIVKSPDQKKFVYLESRKMSEKEIEDMANAAGSGKRQVIQYNVIRPDGSTSMVTDYSYNNEFKLTNAGQLVYINEETGEVYADDKLVGKFPLKAGDRLNSDAVLIGNEVSQTAYYDGAEGTFTYIDGTVKKLGMTAPHFSSENGKGYVSWFRKCGKDIYVAKYPY
jgi:hypothetical protein